MIELPNVAKPAQNTVDLSTKMQGLTIKSKPIPVNPGKDPEPFVTSDQIGHRNSVSARESQTKKAGDLKRSSQSNLTKLTSNPSTKKPGNISAKQLPNPSIDELHEDQQDANASDKQTPSFTKSPTKLESTTANDTASPLKARFLSFSKRIKGSMSGAGASTSEMLKRNNPDLKTKKNSNAALPVFKKADLPSASAYDISNAGGAPVLPKGLEEYYVIRRVGKGGFATVFLVRLKASTGRYYALKVIKKAEVVRLKQEKQIMNEKNILFELTHPLLIDLYCAFQSPSNLFMVLEFVAGGDLFTLLRKAKMFPEAQAKFYCSEVLSVLEYLHSQKVVYRDLKPENILLDSTGHIKLADFGFAKRLSTTTSSFCGTPDYIAAEIVASKPYTFSVDWWSLGVLIFELNSGKTPFRADDSEGIYTNIQSGKIQWTPEINGPIKEVCQGLLETDPRKRLGAKGADDIKKQAWFNGIPWDDINHRGMKPPVIPHVSTPEALEMEKLTKGVQSDYKDILGDSLPNEKFTDPFNGAFKGF